MRYALDGHGYIFSCTVIIFHPHVCAKSLHSGLIVRMRLSFFSRRQPLSCFSRAMAVRMSSAACKVVPRCKTESSAGSSPARFHAAGPLQFSGSFRPLRQPGVPLPLIHIIICIALWTAVLVAYSVMAATRKSIGPRSCIAWSWCTALGLSRYRQNEEGGYGQDDQINCLSILSIFVKQRTYLATLPNRFEILITFQIALKKHLLP